MEPSHVGLLKLDFLLGSARPSELAARVPANVADERSAETCQADATIVSYACADDPRRSG